MVVHNFFKMCSVLPALAIMPAVAVTEPFSAENNQHLSGTYSGITTNTDSTKAGVVTIGYDTTGVVVDNGTIFSGNSTSGAAAGAIKALNGFSIGRGVTFENNSADLIGGAMYIKLVGGDASSPDLSPNQNVTIGRDVKFIGNTAKDFGGAITLEHGNLTIQNGGLFQNNTTTNAEPTFGGGAIAVYSAPENGPIAGSKLNVNDADFISNKSAAHAGAVALFDTAGTATLVNNEFTGNTAALYGGAVGNLGTMGIVGGEFESNSATMGGAIYNMGKLTINGVDFGDAETERELVDSKWVTNVIKSEGNTATQQGGAIFTGAGDLTVIGGTFEYNSAGTGGGAIAAIGNDNYTAESDLAKVNITRSIFANNSVTGAEGFAGAIYAGRNSDITITSSTFRGNTADYASAILANSITTDANGTSLGGTLNIANTVFDSNIANIDGGAVQAMAKTTITNSTFKNNKSGDGADGAGALFIGATGKVMLDNVLFAKNSTGNRGGAISTRDADLGNNKDARLDILNSTFTGNTAGTNGGAFDNYLYSSVQHETAVFIDNTTFTNNFANASGGAIYNHGKADRGGNTASMVLEDVTMTGNSAVDLGGAIYNEENGGITLAGTNTFANNVHQIKYSDTDTNKIVSSQVNDIYNLGNITIASGVTTIGSGIAGAGTLVIENGATLNIGTATLQQSALTLNGTLTADILTTGRDGAINRGNSTAAATESVAYGKIFADNISVGENGSLNLNISSTGTYQLFKSGGATIALENINAGNTYDISLNSDGALVVANKSVNQIAADNNISDSSAQIVSVLSDPNRTDLAAVSLRVQQELKAGNSEFVNNELSKANPDNKPIAQSVASTAQNQVLSLAASRMAGGAVVGRNGGDFANAEYGMWAHGLFNKSKMGDQFHGYTRGVAVGFDANIDKKYTLGIGAAFNNTDVHAANARNTDISSNSLFAYAQYKPSKWFINGALTYTKSQYDETSNMLGLQLRNEYDVDSYGASMMTGYDFASGFTPEIGARYLYIRGTEYEDAIGSRVTGDNTNYLTSVAGLRYTFNLDTDSTWNWRPEMRAAITYDIVSDGAYATVDNSGAAAYVIDAEKLSRMGGEFGLGLNMTYNGLDILLKYDLTLRQDYTSQTGMVKFRIDF